MIKYFMFPTKTVCGITLTNKKEITEEINEYEVKNNLKIMQIYSCDDGLFVVFEKSK